LRLKPDKWARMVVSDEQRNFINNFIERQSPQVRLDHLLRGKLVRLSKRVEVIDNNKDTSVLHNLSMKL
jgi:hypothetical protein